MTKPLFCKDCRYFPIKDGPYPAGCQNPVTAQYDLVSGEPIPLRCTDARKVPRDGIEPWCGPEGKLFEARQRRESQIELVQP